ncbi:MAG: hypothetical protein GY828_02945 [Candidatus Gracilibacteria bacterium]|nr:hypothetical protein [Candidatus Gracilibacteria bacterium]
MQKSGKQASILLWSIFLSMVITLSFVSISTNITKVLHDNSQTIGKIKGNFQLETILSSESHESQTLNNQSYIYFEPKNEYSSTLYTGTQQSFSFSGETDAPIRIRILQGGPLKYLYSTGSSSHISGSFLSYISFSGGLIPTNTGGILQLENLGGYTSYQLISDTDFIKPEISYEIWKQIGNKNVIVKSSSLESGK